MTHGDTMHADLMPIDTMPAPTTPRRKTYVRRIIAGGLATLAGSLLVATYAAAQNNANQVIAKIGSTEITRAMLRQDMPGGVDNPALEREVLQSMIARKLLADEARRQGIDRTPIGAMVMKRAGEVTTVGLLEQKFAGKPQAVSDVQLREFIAAHPLMFAQRHLIALDQFLVPQTSKSTMQGFIAANTMAEFSDVLVRDRIQYQRGAVVLDTLNLPPEAATKISGFGPGAVFITPRPDGSVALSGVTSNTVAPITGASAERMARLMLQKTQVLQKVQSASAAIVKAGQDKVKINPQYAPKKS